MKFQHCGQKLLACYICLSWKVDVIFQNWHYCTYVLANRVISLQNVTHLSPLNLINISMLFFLCNIELSFSKIAFRNPFGWPFVNFEQFFFFTFSILMWEAVGMIKLKFLYLFFFFKLEMSLSLLYGTLYIGYWDSRWILGCLEIIITFEMYFCKGSKAEWHVKLCVCVTSFCKYFCEGSKAEWHVKLCMCVTSFCKLY